MLIYDLEYTPVCDLECTPIYDLECTPVYDLEYVPIYDLEHAPIYGQVIIAAGAHGWEDIENNRRIYAEAVGEIARFFFQKKKGKT